MAARKQRKRPEETTNKGVSGRTNALIIGADLAGRAAAACAAAFRAWAVRATEQAGVVPAAIHAECEARVADGLLVARCAALLAAGDADAVAVWRRAPALVGWWHVGTELVAVAGDARRLPQASALCTAAPRMVSNVGRKH